MQMDANLQATYDKLKPLRSRPNMSLKPTPLLRKTFIDRHGQERPVKLRDYQVQMIFQLLGMTRFIVGDDTGLGKTIETIAALCYLWSMKPNQKVIVLAKKNSVLQWAREFGKFTTGVRVIVSKGTPKQREGARTQYEESTGPTVLICGYRSMVRDFNSIQEWRDYVLICDEATVFKNPGTQIHQICRYMGQVASRCWGLTATLIKNHLIEGYGIFKVVAPAVFMHSATGFMNDYCIVRMQRVKGNRQVPIIVGYRPKDIQRFRQHIDPFYLGRPKHEVAKELPVLQIRDIEVGLTKFQASKYQEALAGLLEMGDGEEKETDPLTAIIYCQEIVNHPCLLDFEGETSEKLDALEEMLTDGGEFEGQKVIVFTRFRKMVDFAVDYLAKKGVKCVRVTGSEDEDQRQAAMDTFQDPDSDNNVIFITMAGGDAINLQAAKALVFYDTPWSAGDYLQILGRMIRIGSDHDRVYALHLISKGTIDDRVQGVLKKKMELVEAILGKRIKGEDDDVEDAEAMFAVESEMKELFEGLNEDARAMRKKAS